MQVAWYDADQEFTKFSHYFSEALHQTPPVDLSSLDEFINEKLELDPGQGGHKQMVQMDKRVSKPFKS